MQDTATRQAQDRARLREQLMQSCTLVRLDRGVVEFVIGDGSGGMDDEAVLDMFLMAGFVTGRSQ